jgi:hypothetical protein
MTALALHLLLGLAAVMLVRQCWAAAAPTTLALRVGVVFYALMITTATVLGAGGMLTAPVLLAVLLVLVVALAAWTRPWAWAWEKPAAPPLWLVIVGLAVAAIYIVRLHALSFAPPLNQDGLSYQLPFAVHMQRHADLSRPLLFFLDVSYPYYPRAGTVPYFFMLLAGREWLLNFVQAPFVVIGALAAYRLIRQYGCTQAVAAAGAVTFALLPAVVSQAGQCFVDLLMAGSFLAALCCLAAADEDDLLTGLLAAGLVLGSKPHGALAFLVLVPGILLWQRVLLRPRNLVGIGFAIAIAGATHWQNLFETGNPLYPGVVEILGVTLLDGRLTFPPQSLSGMLVRFASTVLRADVVGWLPLASAAAVVAPAMGSGSGPGGDCGAPEVRPGILSVATPAPAAVGDSRVGACAVLCARPCPARRHRGLAASGLAGVQPVDDRAGVGAGTAAVRGVGGHHDRSGEAAAPGRRGTGGGGACHVLPGALADPAG